MLVALPLGGPWCDLRVKRLFSFKNRRPLPLWLHKRRVACFQVLRACDSQPCVCGRSLNVTP